MDRFDRHTARRLRPLAEPLPMSAQADPADPFAPEPLPASAVHGAPEQTTVMGFAPSTEGSGPNGSSMQFLPDDPNELDRAAGKMQLILLPLAAGGAAATLAATQTRNPWWIGVAGLGVAGVTFAVGVLG